MRHPDPDSSTARASALGAPLATWAAMRLFAGSALLVILLVVSGMRAYDRPTWLLEVLPVIVALPVLWLSYGRFRLTDLLYFWLFAHALVLIVGGTYTYARVPLGFALANVLHIVRNPYDKIGHFFQGFVPALIAREVLIRGNFVRGRRMLVFIVVSIVLAISALYELFEWGTAVILGQGATDFLGTQGDPWDTQSDMLFALVGSVSCLGLLSRWHDQQLARLNALR